tara:strand:- start:4498 stop:5025 length:528 start_codon:yes stop_codon:yes gene_type:complete
MQNIENLASNISLIIFDVDGVLTDGSLYLDDDGKEMKAFNSRDGHGMKMLQEAGILIGIITGRKSNVVSARMASLNIEYVLQGVEDKLEAYNKIKNIVGLKNSQIACVGDDIVDLPMMNEAGLSICVADGHEIVKQKAHYITKMKGGRGAAREICEMILKSQNKLDSSIKKYIEL